MWIICLRNATRDIHLKVTSFDTTLNELRVANICTQKKVNPKEKKILKVVLQILFPSGYQVHSTSKIYKVLEEVIFRGQRKQKIKKLVAVLQGQVQWQYYS